MPNICDTEFGARRKEQEMPVTEVQYGEAARATASLETLTKATLVSSTHRGGNRIGWEYCS